MRLSIVILAAGQGKRMYSDLPKVLHPLADKPLLEHVLLCAIQLQPEAIYIVYGHGGELVKEQLAATVEQLNVKVNWVKQAAQLGTGHAVAQAIPSIPDEHHVLVLYGDVPLIKSSTLHMLCQQVAPQQLGLLTVTLANPFGYGRIVRVQGQVTKIVEEKEADVATKTIQEVNTGILVLPAKELRHWLSQLDNNNAQGEYYLTDVIALAVQNNFTIATHSPSDADEVLGVNDRVQLAYLERRYQTQQVNQLMLSGVTVRDPQRLDIRGTVKTGKDVIIDVNVILEGLVTLGNGVKIGPNVYIRNATIEDNVEILANTVIEDSTIGSQSRIGPFARLRPNTVLNHAVHIGNFVEIKKSTVAHHSKINHLSYVGDSDVGSEVNIGAGTITCNYDGANKHKTIIGDRVFIGSDTQLIAPVKVGNGATIGAGSTITSEVPAEQLTLSRAQQKTIPNWKRPIKKRG